LGAFSYCKHGNGFVEILVDMHIFASISVYHFEITRFNGRHIFFKEENGGDFSYVMLLFFLAGKLKVNFFSVIVGILIVP